MVTEEEEGGIIDRDDQKQEATEAEGIVFPDLRNINRITQLNLNHFYFLMHVYFEIKENPP